MKVALAEWQGRIAPVFDVAGTVLVLDTESDLEQSVSIPTDDPHSKINILKEHKIDVLICGAISRRVREYAEELGLRVHPFISGEVGEVWEAWKSVMLDQACYSMPGCRRCRRRQGHFN